MDQSERSDKRAKILEAALEVFSRKGVQSTRIADIASEAGIAYGLLYHYFKNKEDVLETLFLEQWRELGDRIRAAGREGQDTTERLLRVAEMFLSAHSSSPKAVELVVLQVSNTALDPQPLQVELMSAAYAAFAEILDQGRAEGVLREDIPHQLMMLAFMGPLHLVIQAQVTEAFQGPTDFEAKSAQLIVDLFMRGAAA